MRGQGRCLGVHLDVDVFTYCVEGWRLGIVTLVCSLIKGFSVLFHNIFWSKRLAYGCLRSLLGSELVFGLLWLMVLEYIHGCSFNVLCACCCVRCLSALIWKLVQGVEFADRHVSWCFFISNV